jgi:hypothetical protein
MPYPRTKSQTDSVSVSQLLNIYAKKKTKLRRMLNGCILKSSASQTHTFIVSRCSDRGETFKSAKNCEINYNASSIINKNFCVKVQQKLAKKAPTRVSA